MKTQSCTSISSISQTEAFFPQADTDLRSYRASSGYLSFFDPAPAEDCPDGRPPFPVSCGNAVLAYYANLVNGQVELDFKGRGWIGTHETEVETRNLSDALFQLVTVFDGLNRAVEEKEAGSHSSVVITSTNAPDAPERRKMLYTNEYFSSPISMSRLHEEVARSLENGRFKFRLVHRERITSKLGELAYLTIESSVQLNRASGKGRNARVTSVSLQSQIFFTHL